MLTSAAAGWLTDAGVRPGMTVAWQLPSHVSAAVVMLALARMPVVQAPVLHLYRRREVALQSMSHVPTSCWSMSRRLPRQHPGYLLSWCPPTSSGDCVTHPPQAASLKLPDPRPSRAGCTSPPAPPAVRKPHVTPTPRCSAPRGVMSPISDWAPIREKSAPSHFRSLTSAAWSISPPLCSATFRWC